MKFIKAKRLLLHSLFDTGTGVVTGNKALKQVEVAVHFWLLILLKVNWAFLSEAILPLRHISAI